MATFNKFNQFVEDVAEGVHVLGVDQLVLALTATSAAPVASNSVLADLTEIAYTNLSSRNVTTASSAQSGGTYSLKLTDHVLTATGGNVAAFRYVVLYNDTPTSPANPLIGWYDYGSALALATGDTLTVDFNASGALTIV